MEREAPEVVERLRVQRSAFPHLREADFDAALKSLSVFELNCLLDLKPESSTADTISILLVMHTVSQVGVHN